MNNKELIKAGHDLAKELHCAESAALVSDLASQLEVQLVRSNALAAKLSMVNGLMDAAEQANKLAQEATEKLVQERDALAAENAGLKRAAEFATASDMWEDLGCDVYRYQYIDWYVDGLKAAMETPATDAFLAEVRAQGVEMFAEHCQKRRGEMMKSEPNEAASNEAITATRRAGEFALYFAAQLRKGAAQ